MNWIGLESDFPQQIWPLQRIPMMDPESETPNYVLHVWNGGHWDEHSLETTKKRLLPQSIFVKIPQHEHCGPKITKIPLNVLQLYGYEADPKIKEYEMLMENVVNDISAAETEQFIYEDFIFIDAQSAQSSGLKPKSAWVSMKFLSGNHAMKDCSGCSGREKIIVPQYKYMKRALSADQGKTWFFSDIAPLYGHKDPYTSLADSSHLPSFQDIVLIPGFGYVSSFNLPNLGFKPILFFGEEIMGNDPHVYELVYMDNGRVIKIRSSTECGTDNNAELAVEKQKKVSITMGASNTKLILDKRKGIERTHELLDNQALGIPNWGWVQPSAATQWFIRTRTKSEIPGPKDLLLYMMPFVQEKLIMAWHQPIGTPKEVILFDSSKLDHCEGLCLLPGKGWTGDQTLTRCGFKNRCHPNSTVEMDKENNGEELNFYAGIILKEDLVKKKKKVQKIIQLNEGVQPLEYTGILRDSSSLSKLNDWYLIPAYGWVRGASLPFYGFFAQIATNEDKDAWEGDLSEEDCDENIYGHLVVTHANKQLCSVKPEFPLDLAKNPFYKPALVETTEKLDISLSLPADHEHLKTENSTQKFFRNSQRRRRKKFASPTEKEGTDPLLHVALYSQEESSNFDETTNPPEKNRDHRRNPTAQ